VSKENVLKKEFKKNDVQRMRNLIQGKQDESTKTIVGFTKKKEFYEEGDIWEADGRTWTIKDGIRQNVTKLDKAKKAHVMPLLCPKCNKVMKKKLDKQYYNIHKFCFDCVVDFEHELKKTGKWEEYHNNIHNNEIDNKIKEYKLWVEEKVNESNNSFVSEAGDVENWKGKVNKEMVAKNVDEVVEYLESLNSIS